MPYKITAVIVLANEDRDLSDKQQTISLSHTLGEDYTK